jgi:antirestriction protein ArdC
MVVATKTTKKSYPKKDKVDINKELTDKIIQLIESGNTLPWEQPWISVFPLRENGQAYKGKNLLLLLVQMSLKEYSNPTWITYKQAESLGTFVKKSERGTLIEYWSNITKKQDDNEDTDAENSSFLMCRTYSVFNVEQLDSVPEKYQQKDTVKIQSETVDKIEQKLSKFVTLKYGNEGAYYSPSKDVVTMPTKASFKTESGYISVLCHEYAHSTGHKDRLNRDQSGDSKSLDGKYATEELVAELTAAMLCNHLGYEFNGNSASYISSWLKALKNDVKFISKASQAAQKAFDMLVQVIES